MRACSWRAMARRETALTSACRCLLVVCDRDERDRGEITGSDLAAHVSALPHSRGLSLMRTRGGSGAPRGGGAVRAQDVALSILIYSDERREERDFVSL